MAPPQQRKAKKQRAKEQPAQPRNNSAAAVSEAVVFEAEPACRICLGDGLEEEPLLRPCRCDGSMRWAHSSCVVEWLRLNPAAALSCEICGADFEVVFGEEGPPLGLAYFDRELNDPGLKDTGLLRVLLLAFPWMMSMLFMEKRVFASKMLLLVNQTLPIEVSFWTALCWTGIQWVIALIYHALLVLRTSILIAGGAGWKPEDWGARFAKTAIYFEAVEVFLADFGLGLRMLCCIVGIGSAKSLFVVAMNQPLQGCLNYCGPRAVVLSCTLNFVSLAWMLKRAFLDRQPLVSEIRGELLSTGVQSKGD